MKGNRGNIANCKQYLTYYMPDNVWQIEHSRQSKIWISVNSDLDNFLRSSSALVDTVVQEAIFHNENFEKLKIFILKKNAEN